MDDIGELFRKIRQNSSNFVKMKGISLEIEWNSSLSRGKGPPLTREIPAVLSLDNG